MLKYVNVSLSEGDTETDHPVAVRPKVAIIVRSMRIVHNLGARMSSNVARFCCRRRRRSHGWAKGEEVHATVFLG